MHKRDHQIKPEYRQGVLNVLHYISQNLSGDVSLETLAAIANYSPFHFQKIFSEAISESPKQYVMRLRLERAAHHLKVFPNLPVSEIAMGCGFSSPSIFSRAFRNYYRVSAEEFREMSLEDIPAITKQIRKKNETFTQEGSDTWISETINPMEVAMAIDISPLPVVKTYKSMKIACIQTMLTYPESISFAFKSLMKWAIPNDIISPESKFIGIWLDVPFYTSPEKCRYIAGIELKSYIKTNKGIDILTIEEGKYACFSMKGNPESTLKKLIALNHKYLEDTGYEFADIICYEIFEECPANKLYEEIKRKILVPVKLRK